MKNRINGWIIGSKICLPFLVVGFLILLIGWTKTNFLFATIGIVALLVGVFILMFFRDFPRKISAQKYEFVSPADGKIVELQTMEDCEIYGGRCKKVAIFMSIFNAHINRSPFRGVVKKIVYKKGKFFNAMKPDASVENESNTIWLETDKGTIVVKQIAGLVARRIVCNVSEGEYLDIGEKFGMIKFGSRVELFLPPEIEFYVKLNDKVYAGITILGRFL